MFEDPDRKRIEDKEKFNILDEAQCMLCGAHGNDKRNLIVDCMYDINEVVPEALSLHLVEGRLQGHGFYLRICKSCRGGFLSMMGKWAETRKALRDLPKGHDGELLQEYEND